MNVTKIGNLFAIFSRAKSNIFSNRKIQIILKLPYGDTYFRVWIQLIALAVECNNEGRLEIGENNPMTIQNFSKIMGKSNKKLVHSKICLQAKRKHQSNFKSNSYGF
jgi:hypothetical protein